jgi:chromosome partitioning protein
MENCKIIAMTNQKGGVGKTTSTVNLGVGLAKEGKRVLLVDGDPQGSLTISLGINNPDGLSETLATSMLAEIHDMEIPADSGIIHHSEGIDLLPANIELSGVELSLFNTMSREMVMRNVLSRLKQSYDFILIDCMPSLGLMTINALAAADSVIIPSQANYLSTKGMNLLLRSISRVRKQINPNLRIDGILFTMVDSRTNNARSIISSMRTVAGDSLKVFRTEIPRSVRAEEAAEKGKSIYLYDANGKVAQAYTSLTKEVTGIGRESNRSRSDGAR